MAVRAFRTFTSHRRRGGRLKGERTGADCLSPPTNHRRSNHRKPETTCTKKTNMYNYITHIRSWFLSFSHRGLFSISVLKSVAHIWAFLWPTQQPWAPRSCKRQKNVVYCSLIKFKSMIPKCFPFAIRSKVIPEPHNVAKKLKPPEFKGKEVWPSNFGILYVLNAANVGDLPTFPLRQQEK